jgi:hypothetical protein
VVCRRNISTKGPPNCRSLGFARDDKKGRADDRESVVAKGKGVGQAAGLKGEELVVQGKVVLGRKALSFSNRLLL